MGEMNFTIPENYFSSQKRKREDTEIPSMRGDRNCSGSAAATGANAAALPISVQRDPAAMEWM